MSDKEGTYYTVRLAELNTTSTIDGRIYVIDKEDLKKTLDKHIGKTIGEIGTGVIRSFEGSSEQKLQRIRTIEILNGAGTLRGYDIAEDGQRLIVTGHVDFSPTLQKTIEAINDQQPTFGVRAMGIPNLKDNTFSIRELIGFDYIPPQHRPHKPTE